MIQNNRMMKGLIIGLLAGGALGAVLALLYAPKSGRELRSEIKKKADDFMDEAGEHAHSAAVRAGEIMSDAKRRSDQLISDAKR